MYFEFTVLLCVTARSFIHLFMTYLQLVRGYIKTPKLDVDADSSTCAVVPLLDNSSWTRIGYLIHQTVCQMVDFYIFNLENYQHFKSTNSWMGGLRISNFCINRDNSTIIVNGP